jgi:hypothetical protein
VSNFYVGCFEKLFRFIYLKFFRSFADRLVAERFALTLESCDPGLKPVLSLIFDLYLVTLLEKNLSFFVISGLLQPSDISLVKKRGAELCAELGPQVFCCLNF